MVQDTGLAQWTYGTRKAGLYDFAKQRGVSIDDEDMQIEYLLGEINPSGGADGFAQYQLSKYKGYSVSDWENATTPEDAAIAFCWIFEKPGSPHMTTRTQKAREYYERYKDFSEGGFFEENTSGDKRLIGTFTSSLTGRTFTIYNQCKIEGWGRRCNRASQISVCSGYWEGDAIELIGEANDAPDRTMPQYKFLYDKCGLTYSAQNVPSSHTFEDVKRREQIQRGGYVILYVRGADKGETGVGTSGRDWANSMHWVAILGYRQLGEKEEIFVSDSAHDNTGWVPLNEFDNITQSVVFVNENR